MKQLGTVHTLHMKRVLIQGKKPHLFLISWVVTSVGNIPVSPGFVDFCIYTAIMGNEELIGALKSWSILNVNNGNTLLQSCIQHRDVQRYKVNH